VGASFDFAAGRVKRAPRWIQKIGFEWLFRLVQNPRRLWKRYLFSNVFFFFILVKEFFAAPRSRLH
jgi:N-acetylglucosaminyldiphosphoundecaprenol N-acetyl-beta-D-mannosaminyltransferase